MLCLFLFFKQKTAYEMRSSDWSSDVCSSDLVAILFAAVLLESAASIFLYERASQFSINGDKARRLAEHLVLSGKLIEEAPRSQRDTVASERSEEHTSELQSLMRISYAVFCLNKKK